MTIGPKSIEVNALVEELRATAKDEEDGITDIPVDDLLNKAADMLAKMVDQVRDFYNDAERAKGIVVDREIVIQRLESEVGYVKDCADKVDNDMRVLLSALSEQGYTEWVDSEGVIRPIPLAWPLPGGMDEGTMTLKHKMLMAKSHPPRMMNPRPGSLLLAQDPEPFEDEAMTDMEALYQAEKRRALLTWAMANRTTDPVKFKNIQPF